jgi:DNA-binding response OmpR family regulator
MIPPGGAEEHDPTRRVLLVDDNPDATETLATLLRQAGHQVVVMTDADLVMRAATELKPQFVLLDIGLPGRNGFDVARSLRALPELRDSVLVAVSGYGQRDYVRRAREAGFSHYLVKPVNVELLESLLAGRAPPTL